MARLREAAEAAPQLVVIRGRRRVGKSFLIAHAFAGRRGIFFQADEQPEGAHLRLFADQLSRLLPSRLPLRFDDWDSALTAVGDLAREQPLVVAMDEFQWLWDAQPSLDSIIQRHWDVWERNGIRVTLVLSGSALTLMEKLLEPGSPLYGRANYRPLIPPLDYRQAAELAGGRLGAEQLLRRYAVLGGTPQYQVWAGRGGIDRVIVERVLRKGESLYEEPLHLLREEQSIRDPATYFAIVAAIASGRTRPSEIANEAQIEVPNLSKMLGRLIDLGYVETIGPTAPQGPTGGRSVYRLRDPYFRFWFRYVFRNRSLLERERVAEVKEAIEADFDNFMGRAFEDACRDWVGRYAPREAFPQHERLGSWWSRDGQSEIDVVAVDKRRYVFLGSCKWTRRASTRVLETLIAQRELLGPQAAKAKLAVFARGFEPKLVRRAEEEEVELVAASDLFERGR